MGHRERQAYLGRIRERYRRSNKSGKAKILDEFCVICDYHHKHAIRLLNQPFRRKSRKQKVGRKAIYSSAELSKALTKYLACHRSNVQQEV